VGNFLATSASRKELSFRELVIVPNQLLLYMKFNWNETNKEVNLINLVA
jgi:hypothetical protein